MALQLVDKIAASTLTPNMPKHKRDMGLIEVIVIHRNSVARNIVEVAEFYRDNKEEGPTTGFRQPYHFFIKQDGTVEQGHSLETIGAGAAGRNRNGVHIALDGDFRKNLPTPAQLAALTALCAALCSGLGLDPMRCLEAHSTDPAIKLCPGPKLDVTNLRLATKQHLARERLIKMQVLGVK
jgi:N-acetyl-anhydromuramyl-L-alanine amidase AmpD